MARNKTVKVNKFIPKKVINIGGFELRQYDCLLQKERIELFKEKERIYSQVHSYWNIIVKFADKKGISYEEAIETLQNATEDNTELVPYLLELANTKAEAAFNDIEYSISVITHLLTSRLEDRWIDDNIEDLKEAFALSQAEIDILTNTDSNERFSTQSFMDIIRKIVINLPTDSYEQLLQFSLNEESSANKLQTKNVEKVDAEKLNDPKF